MPQKAKTLEEIRHIAERIQCMDRKLRIGPVDGFFLQVVYDEANVLTGVVEEQRARKWYVSPFSTVSEVVRTAHKALTCSMEHVIGEHFEYRGKRIYSPHYNADDLAQLDDSIRLDRREP